jgi:hypothetical protein
MPEWEGREGGREKGRKEGRLFSVCPPWYFSFSQLKEDGERTCILLSGGASQSQRGEKAVWPLSIGNARPHPTLGTRSIRICVSFSLL